MRLAACKCRQLRQMDGRWQALRPRRGKARLRFFVVFYLKKKMFVGSWHIAFQTYLLAIVSPISSPKASTFSSEKRTEGIYRRVPEHQKGKKKKAERVILRVKKTLQGAHHATTSAASRSLSGCNLSTRGQLAARICMAFLQSAAFIFPFFAGLRTSEMNAWKVAALGRGTCF